MTRAVGLTVLGHVKSPVIRFIRTSASLLLTMDITNTANSPDWRIALGFTDRLTAIQSL